MKHASCWLSVLVPAYDVQDYVEECLLSVIHQAGPGVEIIVVNDGSSDATGDVVAAVERRHADVVTARDHAVNRGIGATRNRLVDMARGEYLWFVDADDSVRMGAVESLRRIVDRHRPDLVLCDYSRHRGRHERRGRTFAGPSRTLVSDTSALVAGLFEAGQLHPWSKISRRALWQNDLRFPDGRVFEDVTVMPRLAIRAANAYHEPEPWVTYRQWPGSILATMNPRKCIDLTRALADFPADLRARDAWLSKRALFAMRHYSARHFVGAMRHLARCDQPTVAREAAAKCLGYFLQSIDGQIDRLLSHYLKRGWVWRWLRLQHWIRVAGRGTGTTPGSRLPIGL
jgi:glycosyltransferase involved in cell wall biosynthesis